MSETINEMRQSIKNFVSGLVYDKDECNNYIYMNSLNSSKLNAADLWLRKQKIKINTYDILSEQMFIQYGCLIYKDGLYQDKIEKIFSYFKEVDYLVRNYDKQYSCLSEELKILRNNTEFLMDGTQKPLANNIKKFLFRGGQKPLDCLNDLILECDTNPLIKEIYFMHNYVERGFDLAVSKTIASDLYIDNQSFIEELKICKNDLDENFFRINLHYLKEVMVYHRNYELRIIEKYKYKNRSEFINDLSRTIMIIKSFYSGVIYENNIIHDDLIKWLEKRKPQECFNIESVKDMFKENIKYFDENDKSLPYLPKSLFRIEEKIIKLENYIDALESLSTENRELLKIQEHIAQTIVFGIETLTEEERKNLLFDIGKVIDVYNNMKAKRYGISPETRNLFDKKIFSIIKLKEALGYLQTEGY